MKVMTLRSKKSRWLIPLVLSASCFYLYPEKALSLKFTAIADVPYNKEQAWRLARQIRKDIPDDSEFVIHLGDMRSAATGDVCTRREFRNVANILRKSKVPVFAILGDNDWNDCPNPEQAKRMWEDIFIDFESKYWPKKFSVIRHDEYKHNFSFVTSNTLFIGLNLVGGKILDQSEWDTRLSAQANWTIELIQDFYSGAKILGVDPSVVIFGHADPRPEHDSFFKPVRDYINNELSNRLPIMYVNGDTHVWDYTPNFYDQYSWLRVTLSGEAIEPPTVFTINGTIASTPPFSSTSVSTTSVSTTSVNPRQVFLYDRQNVCEYCGLKSGVVVHRYFATGKCVELCVRDKDFWEEMGYGCGNCTETQISLEPY